MSMLQKILGSTAVQVAGRGIMALISVVILKILTQFLSIESYGMYSSIYEFLAFFGIAADLGLFTIAVREMSKGEHSRDFVIGNILCMRFILAFSMMLLAVLAAFLMPSFTGTTIPIGVAVAAPAVFLAILQGTLSSILQVEFKMKHATIALVFGKILSLGWMLGVIFFFYVGNPSDEAFYQLIFAGFLGGVFSFLYTLFQVLRLEKLRPRFDFKYWKTIAFTAGPYGLALVLNMIYFRIDSVMLLLMKGPLEVGLYSPSVRILEILSVISVYFMNSVLPVLSKSLSENVEKARIVLRTAFNFLLMLGLPMSLGIFILAYPIVSLATQPDFLSRLGEGFYGSDIGLMILSVATFFAFITNAFTHTLVAINKQWHLLWMNCLAAIFNICANFVVIPAWGFRGAAFTSVLTEAFIFIAAFTLVRIYFPVSFDYKTITKIIFASSLMGIFVFALRDIAQALSGALGAIILAALAAVFYGAILLLLRAIPEELLKKNPLKAPLL